MAGASVFLAFSNDTLIIEIKEYFEKIGMKIIDTVATIKNNSFISKVAGRSYYSTKTYEIASDSENAYGEGYSLGISMKILQIFC